MLLMNDICLRLKNATISAAATRRVQRSLLETLSDIESSSVPTASTRTNDSQTPPPHTNTTLEPDDEDLMLNATSPVDILTIFMKRHYGDFHLYTEVYVMTAVACLGLIFNMLAIFLLIRERATPTALRAFHIIFIVVDQLFLALNVVFIEIRKFLPNKGKHLDLMNFLSTFLLLIQCFQPWFLYTLASYARATAKRLRGIEPHLLPTAANIFLTLVPILGYCLLYLPPIRILLYEYMPEGRYSLCNVPMENHWNLETQDVPNNDLFYIFVYCIVYVIIAFAFPFFMILSRNKFIIDSLQALQRNPDLLATGIKSAYMALIASVTCNVYLVFVTIKMALLSFYIFDFYYGFIVHSAVFFRYLNVLANFLLITKSCFHFVIVVWYNGNIKYLVSMDLNRLKMTVVPKFILDLLAKCQRCRESMKKRVAKDKDGIDEEKQKNEEQKNEEQKIDEQNDETQLDKNQMNGIPPEENYKAENTP